MSVLKKMKWSKGGIRPAGLVLAWMALLLSVSGTAGDAPALEYKIKAGYLFNFAKFIEWPSTALPASDSPFIIGVLDSGEAFPVLQPLLEGKKVDGHPIQLRAASIERISQGIHILLVTRTSGHLPEGIRASLGKAPTLVVGETDQFAERGGMVGFVREDDVIRLNLNLERAAAAGLKVSAKLSTVAKVVKTQKNP
jgi:YfiR/HmsC-like